MTDPADDELSPDGLTLVRWSVSDGRMSHIIRTPTIVDATGSATILLLGDSGYDATIAWGDDGGFNIDLRHYWRPGTLQLRVDRTAGTFHSIGASGDGAPHPLAILSAFVETHFTAGDVAREAVGIAADRAWQERLDREKRRGTRALWTILAIGAGVAVWLLFFRR